MKSESWLQVKPRSQSIYGVHNALWVCPLPSVRHMSLCGKRQENERGMCIDGLTHSTYSEYLNDVQVGDYLREKAVPNQSQKRFEDLFNLGRSCHYCVS